MTDLLRLGDRFEAVDRPELGGVVVGIQMRDGSEPRQVAGAYRAHVARFTVQTRAGGFQSLSFYGTPPCPAPVRPPGAGLH